MVWTASLPGPRLIIMVPSYSTLVQTSIRAPPPVSLSVCSESRMETLKHYEVIENRNNTWRSYINYEIDTLYIIQSKILPCFHCELPRGSENVRSVLIGLGCLSYRTLGGMDAGSTRLIDSSLRFIQETFPQLRNLSIWTVGKDDYLVSNSTKFPWYSEYFGAPCCEFGELESSTEVVTAAREKYKLLRKELKWDVELSFLGGRQVCRDIILVLKQLVFVV